MKLIKNLYKTRKININEKRLLQIIDEFGWGGESTTNLSSLMYDKTIYFLSESKNLNFIELTKKSYTIRKLHLNEISYSELKLNNKTIISTSNLADERQFYHLVDEIAELANNAKLTILINFKDSSKPVEFDYYIGTSQPDKWLDGVVACVAELLNSIAKTLWQDEGTLRCPVEACTGWISRVEIPNEPMFWGCGECGNVWHHRKPLNDAISQILEKHNYRGQVYTKSAWGWTAVPLESEPADYRELVENEFIGS